MSGYRLRPKAIEDLEAIGDFIAADNPARAVSFVEELRGLCARIAERPRSFRRRDGLAALTEADLADALAFAGRAAAITCTRAGADPPRRDEL